MIPRLLVIALLLPTLCLAEPTTRPAEHPTTTPTTGPTTQRSRFPSPAELLKKLEDSQVQKKHRVAYIELTEPLVERPEEFSFLAPDAGGTTHQSLVARLYQARDDANVKAVLVTLDGAGLNLAQAQEVRDALKAVSNGGKNTFVYADAYDTATYTLATGATNVCLMEAGEIMLPGPGVQTLFARSLLDKVGVRADYVQIGEYKGAEEPFTRTEGSEQLRGEMNKLVQGMYDQIVAGISRDRKLPADKIRAIIDELMIDAESAKARGLVDHLVDMEDLRELLAEQLGGPIDLVPKYGQPEADAVDFSNPFAFFSLFAKKPRGESKPSVALVHLDGMIVDGEGSAGLTGGATGSTDLREAFRIARRDDDVKAVVIRIDSPGGSALASESVWQAARRLAEEKPVIVSIGSMAASGGYYVASAGDYVFADPAAIVGSIGVVGGKMVMKDLLDRLGVASETFSRGRNAELFSSSAPFTDDQRELVKKWMTRTYEQFLDRIQTTRREKIKDIDAVARGRVFLAQQAKDLGMVDALGGVQDAVAYAAEQAGMRPGEFEVRVIPQPKSFAEVFFGEGASAVAPRVEVSVESPLRHLAPDARRLLLQQVQAMQLLQKRPVMLVSPLVVTSP